MSDVLVRIEGRLGRITLDRPRALNALTLDMIGVIDAALASWATDPAIVAVLIDGAGDRGLCAGGDIRALYAPACAGDLGPARAFFRAEYRLNARIARIAKPYIAFMDGIVMGGGIGVSSHGSVRIVTETARLAMPEVGIGFLPEVGGTFLLGRAPDNLGLHLALTGGPIGAADAILCGLADVHVAATRLQALGQALAGCANAEAVRDCVAAHASPPHAGMLDAARDWIEPCYAGATVEDILQALRDRPEPEAAAAAALIGRQCPFSLKIALRAVREARTASGLEACLEREYRLALACIARPDFAEGVRAAVMDKDRNPAWSPAKLGAVTPAMVQASFAAPDHGGLDLARAIAI